VIGMHIFQLNAAVHWLESKHETLSKNPISKRKDYASRDRYRL